MSEVFYETEAEFLANYSMKDYSQISATVDLNIFTIKNGKLCLLLVRRGNHPFRGYWALPGGFVDVNENIDEAAQRELLEETNIEIEASYLEQLKTYGGPDRDPRGFVISTAYVALLPNVANPLAGDDAAEAHFFPIEDVLSSDFDLAFDHRTIITDALERVRAKIEYSTVAFHFINSDAFTISELRNVYEIVWGEPITPSNFRRKIQSVPNLITPTGARRSSIVQGGRSSDLYRAGTAIEIYPPFRRG